MTERQDIGAWLQGQPAVTALNNPDLFYVYQGGADKQVTFQFLSTALGGGGGGGNIAQEAVSVTGTNTLAPLSQSATGTVFLLIVNGQTFLPLGGSPPFTVSGTGVSWNFTNAGFSLLTSDSVIAVYSH